MLFNNSWEELRSSLDKVQADIEFNSALWPTNHVCQLLIIGEDHRFYRHIGVDPIALCRAVWKTIFCRKRQGGSTIAMQLVRTLTGRYEKTAYRKLREIVLAIRLTRYIERDSIPIIYVWVAYYGSGMNNYKQACSRLGLEADLMSDVDVAKLVARLKYPEPRRYSAQRESQIWLRALHLLELKKRIKQRCSTQGKNGTISNCSADSWIN